MSLSIAANRLSGSNRIRREWTRGWGENKEGDAPTHLDLKVQPKREAQGLDQEPIAMAIRSANSS